jgi:hypothetical protein
MERQFWLNNRFLKNMKKKIDFIACLVITLQSKKIKEKGGLQNDFNK